MGDGKALQAGTSHNLGQHFATAYGIEFLDKNQERAKPWSTSWGSSTRMIGGLIMTHGDDAGLVLPPRVAPYQVVIVPIPPRKGDVSEVVLPKAREVAALLRQAGVRVHLDDRDQFQPGFKYADWEMRGVPLRLEIGPKDIEKDQCVLVRRDTREKAFVPLAGIGAAAPDVLTQIQANLLARARQFVADNTTRVSTYDEFKEVMSTKRGLILAGWNGDPAVEARIKEETKATVRVMAIDDVREASCIVTGEPGREVYFAQAY
jgi:prolyl-tRNA synthetase